MKAYTMDLRERVMKVYDENKWTIGQIAQRFKVGADPKGRSEGVGPLLL